MTETRDRMAIVGAGPVGLGAAKALQHAGIPYDQFDADVGVGGNWRHGVFETTHIISSRKTTELPDFPMPDTYPEFPSRGQMLAYLEDYARHFDLGSGIQFETTIVHIRPVEDERWELTFDSGERRIYKGVLVCNGHHWSRRWPEYPGEFSGEMIHTKDYKSPDQLRGKRVLVIGGGNSACDVASEAARVGAASHISQRRGYWILPKTLFGVPTVELVKPWMPLGLQRLVLRIALRIVVGKYTQYGLEEPDHRIFERHPTINSELLYYLKQGTLTPHPDIARFDGQTVEFVDGVRERFDIVVCATGYHVAYPFLADGLVEVRGPIPQVHGGSMLPEYKHLYLVGWGQVRYGFGPLVTPGMELLAKIIQLQDTMELPLGYVLKRLGDKVPTTHLLDPHESLRNIRRGHRRLWLLSRAEKFLRTRSQDLRVHPPLPFPADGPEPLEAF